MGLISMLANGIPQRKSLTDELCKDSIVRWIAVVSGCRSSSVWTLAFLPRRHARNHQTGVWESLLPVAVAFSLSQILTVGLA